MRLAFAVIIAITFCAMTLCTMTFSPEPASAQAIDLSTIKCKDFLDSGKETMGYILVWLDGYFTNEDDPAVVDLNKMKERTERLGEYCAKNPTHGLLTAAEEVMER
jgi:acid stress chaperone HdeB